MALYAIGDLHLSLTANKPMDVFGGAWIGYVEKIKHGFSLISDEDAVVLCGDSSWGMSLSESEADFRFISELPGRKIILKGNHDYWWTTRSKMEAFFEEKGFCNLSILHNDCHMHGDTALCGTRGWMYEEDFAAGDEKVYRRELQRLKTSLDAARRRGAARILCFLHYPPLYAGYRSEETLGLLAEYGVEHCFYGHLHGKSQRLAFRGETGRTAFSLVAGDAVDFIPVKIL